jgi:protoheme IX farnesyltransferase
MTIDAVAVSSRPLWLTTIRNYIALTKPGIIGLLLVTTVPAMMVADRGWPGTMLVVATLVGGTLSAAGANTINCWYDRDIDAVMRRTRNRPLVTGAIHPNQALTFGIGLGAFAFLFLAVTTTLVAAVLSLSALLFYVLIYTMWLKRRTPQNIVIDYQEAHVPMLPVIKGAAYTRTQVLIYSVLLVAVSLVLGPAGDLGWIYLGSAIASGAVFIALAGQLWRRPESTSPMRLFSYSLLYLAIVFAAMGLDALILG